MKKIYILTLILCMMQLYGFAQIVSGKVSDETGQGLPGVNVIIKNTSTGTTTDAEGKYTLNVPQSNDAVLIFSFIGYDRQEVPVNSQTSVSVQLKPDVSALQEVVVVAYGEQKKITLTGAVSSVSGDEIRRNPSASLQNVLAGRLPGFSSQQRSGKPGRDGADFYIRGQSSYNTGSSGPMIIVDDIEFSPDQFSRLDPNEIETLSILKDASTTSIYGIKGANGVVVITTRRGKIGKPQITLRAESGYSTPGRLPQFLDAYETASMYNQAQINDNALNPSPTFTPKFTDQDLELFRTGEDPYGHPNVNWKKVLFKDFTQQYRGNMDINGGTEKVKYFISVGYLWQDGLLKDYSKNQDVRANYYHTRYNYRSNLDIAVTKTLDMRLDLYGNIGEINDPSVGSPFGKNDVFYDYSSFLSLAPFAYPVKNPDGSFGYSVWQRNEAGSGQYNSNNIVGRLTYYGYRRNFENNMNFIASAKQKLDFITKGLSLKGTVSYGSTHSYYRQMQRDQFPSFIYNPSTDTYEPRDPNIYRVRRFFLEYGAGSTTRPVTLQAILNYDRTINDNHHVYGLVLFNQQTKLQRSDNVDYNFVPENFRGYSGRIGYDYKEKYLFQANFAYNGSDRFAEAHRYGAFPAVSAGWNISEEPFFKLSFVNRLKLRSSYGLVGNDKLGNDFTYYYQQVYSGGNGVGNLSNSFGFSNNGSSGIREGSLPNFNVTWEKEKKFDVGLELGVFGNKISATFDYFNNDRYDILTRRGTVSAIFGQTLPPVNLGRVNNKGYEVDLTFRHDINDALSFSIKGAYSVAKNKILFQDEPTPLYPYQAYTGNSIGQQRLYKFIGFYHDQADINNSPKTPSAARPGDLKYEDVNNDNVINEFDMVVTGYPNLPNTVYGLTLGTRFKNFNLSLFFQGAKNFSVRGIAEAIQAFGSNLMDIHRHAWTPEIGDAAQYPVLSHNPGVSNPISFPSTFWNITGDYLRLKTAELSYTIPKALVKKIGARDVRIYTNGYNLFTWTKLDKRYEFDPEINTGQDRTTYPPMRMINVGLSVTF